MADQEICLSLVPDLKSQIWKASTIFNIMERFGCLPELMVTNGQNHMKRSSSQHMFPLDDEKSHECLVLELSIPIGRWKG
jgi:hypothetical protein